MNTTDRVPLYQEVQDYIRDLIESEGLKAGDRIPTEKELMERFNVSKITVVNALSGLANKKIINRVPGRGSFVNGEVSQSRQSPDVPIAERREAGNQTGIIGLVMPS